MLDTLTTVIDTITWIMQLPTMLPWPVPTGIALYTLIAIITGCPHCMAPNMDWPLDLLHAVLTALGEEGTDESG